MSRAAQWLKLIEAAAHDFQFRPPEGKDEAKAYLLALIEHVESRDLARGFELRVGTKQADWTPEMVDSFKASMTRRPRRDPERFRKPFNIFKIATVKVEPPIDDATLRRFVDGTLQHMINLRTEAPAAELPLLVGGLTTDAELLTTTVARADRIAFITAMARHEPLFGWFVASDMFIHSIEMGEVKRASKQDVIGIHFGTAPLVASWCGLTTSSTASCICCRRVRISFNPPPRSMIRMPSSLRRRPRACRHDSTRGKDSVEKRPRCARRQSDGRHVVDRDCGGPPAQDRRVAGDG